MAPSTRSHPSMPPRYGQPEGIEIVDYVLGTTRSVRKRLDLDRPVPDQVIFDCLDLAEQAPTGGNQSTRRWLLIRDSSTKMALADIYRSAGGDWAIHQAVALAGTGRPGEAAMSSAAHLAQHLEDVPAIVIAAIWGTHDGSSKPGLFDSVIQSAWRFCLALRARGLGSAWTTMHLNASDHVAELLAIPDGVTQIVLLPVAYTIGHEFRQADQVWSLVSDIDLPARFSEEFMGAEWLDEPAPGARFEGRNGIVGFREWTTTAIVAAWLPGEEFAWKIGSPTDTPSATWRFQILPQAGSTRLKFSVVLGPGESYLTHAIAKQPEHESAIIASRQDQHRANMTLTVEGIKRLAEAM